MKTVAIFVLAIAAMASAKSHATSNRISYQQAMKVKSIQCDVCTFIVTELDNVIMADQTQEDIIKAVEEVCTLVDGVISGLGATCNALVESYLPQIIDGLVHNQLSPASVCGTLTLC